MVNVTIDWLLESCSKIYAFGGLINERNLKQYVNENEVQTILTQKGIKAIDNEQYNKKKFIAVLPGIGIADCFVRANY